jgi:hypothetical protein
MLLSVIFQLADASKLDFAAGGIVLAAMLSGIPHRPGSHRGGRGAEAGDRGREWLIRAREETSTLTGHLSALAVALKNTPRESRMEAVRPPDAAPPN